MVKNYQVSIYNEFDSLVDTKNIKAENIAVGSDAYIFVNYNHESGNFDTVAVIDRTSTRAIDIIVDGEPL